MKRHVVKVYNIVLHMFKCKVNINYSIHVWPSEVKLILQFYAGCTKKVEKKEKYPLRSLMSYSSIMVNSTPLLMANSESLGQNRLEYQISGLYLNLWESYGLTKMSRNVNRESRSTQKGATPLF